jgi:hypothetical protein
LDDGVGVVLGGAVGSQRYNNNHLNHATFHLAPYLPLAASGYDFIYER